MTEAAVLEVPEEEEELHAALPDVASRRLPWADVATYTADENGAVDSATMLQRAGLDWEVGIRPYMRQTAAGLVPSTRMFETYRIDTDAAVDTKELGGVKGRYEVLQNREAFDFGDSLVADGRARWTHAGQQQDGSKLFMTMLLEEAFTILGQNPMKVYLYLGSSHDGSRACRAFVTPINVFCTNQTNVVKANNLGSFDVPHTSSMREKLAEASDALRRAGDYSKLLRAEAEKLAAVQVTDDKARYILGSIIPARRAKRDEMIDAIVRTANTSPTSADYKGTGWGLLCGLTEFMDHGKKQNTANARFESIMFGEGSKWRLRTAQALAELN